MLYVLTCKRCRKQYFGSTVTKFRLRFNQYNSNITLYGERKRGFKQETFAENFFYPSHSGTHKDISVQIINHCNPNPNPRIFGFTIYIQCFLKGIKRSS